MSFLSQNNHSQIGWSIPNVIGHSIDPYTKQVDDTEGFGAFDSILSMYSLGIRTIDIGGGQHDANSAYLQHKYGIDHVVYDPFMRSEEHNIKVLKLAKQRPFDTCTSLSVLNVIDNPEARIAHIKLCHSVIKECGKVFFKVWPGNGTGIPTIKQDSYQSNRRIETYVEEIQSVFGTHNVFLDMETKTIKCIKYSF